MHAQRVRALPKQDKQSVELEATPLESVDDASSLTEDAATTPPLIEDAAATDVV